MKGNVLLVDDEAYITRNLQQVIPWEELGLEVIATAKNGRDALEWLQRIKIDLILCDIRMPVMDGLELVREIRRIGYDCEMIMISGYQDFEYTRAAIQYGVKDYILKPIQYDELTEIIRKLTLEMRKRFQVHREQKQQLGKMIDLASEKVLYDILMDYTDTSPNNILLAGNEHNLHDKCYQMMVFDVNRYSHISRQWDDKNRKLWNYAIHKLIGEALLQKELTHAVIQMQDGEWCVLIQETSGEVVSLEVLQQWAQDILDAVAMIKIELHAGICIEPLSVTKLSTAYRTVQKRMQLSPDARQLEAYSISAAHTNHSDDPLWENAWELKSAIKLGNAKQAEKILLTLAERLQQVADTSTQRVQQMLNFYALHLLREMKEMQLISAEQEAKMWRQIELGLSIKELISTIREWMTMSISGQDKRKNSEMLMINAKAYIDQRMYQDLGIDEVAQQLGISSSYFSLLFKQYYGETFIEYVTKQRMERAKSLLTLTEKSITQISKEVGYAERRLFPNFIPLFGCNKAA